MNFIVVSKLYAGTVSVHIDLSHLTRKKLKIMISEEKKNEISNKEILQFAIYWN